MTIFSNLDELCYIIDWRIFNNLLAISYLWPAVGDRLAAVGSRPSAVPIAGGTDMQFERWKKELADNAKRVRQLVADVEEEQGRWKPTADDWSILEVVNHLLDEEREDFRVRLGIILRHSGEDWPSIDPGGWVVERRYNERDLAQSLENYLAERKASLAWLDSLEAPDWEASDKAPWGRIRAGDMFAAWVAHDGLHMRQLVEIQHAYLLRLVEPYDVTYAGEW